MRVRLLWDTLTPDLDLWPPLYVLWRIHSKTQLNRCGKENLLPIGHGSVLPPPGGVPIRSHGWRRHNHPFSLSFLEEVLRCVGMNEVHKAVTLFLETMDKQPGSPQTQRWEELVCPTNAPF